MSAAPGAAAWREFWRSRGVRELAALLRDRWEPLAAASPAAREACTFRIASLLASRASRVAIGAELGRIRRDELRVEAAPEEDARAAAAIASWFAGEGR